MKSFDDLKSFVRGLLSDGATDEEVRRAVSEVDTGTTSDEEVDRAIKEVEGEEATDEEVREAIEKMEQEGKN